MDAMQLDLNFVHFDLRFWAPNEFASEGLKEVAEIGFTRTLEAELKNKVGLIRIHRCDRSSFLKYLFGLLQNNIFENKEDF